VINLLRYSSNKLKSSYNVNLVKTNWNLYKIFDRVFLLNIRIIAGKTLENF